METRQLESAPTHRNFLAIVASLAVLASISVARGDGKAFYGLRDSTWRALAEHEQSAVIHHADGVQTMVVAILVELADEDASGLWLLPIPHEDRIPTVEIIDSFPKFMGYDPRGMAASGIDTMFAAFRATQLYPVIIELFTLLPTLSTSRGGVSMLASTTKWGLHSETLEVESSGQLHTYLNSSGVQLEPDELASLEPYCNSEFVIIATWIESGAALRKHFSDRDKYDAHRIPCILVTFDTEEPFYPMRPTSGYGNEVVPLNLFVTGFVEPKCNAEIESKFRVRHFRRTANYDQDVPWLTQDGKGENDPFTSLHLRIPANKMTADLSFFPVSPAGMNAADILLSIYHYRLIGVVGILLWLSISYVSAGIAGRSIWKCWRGPARLGLWNVLTVVGFWFAVRDLDLNARFGGERDEASRQLAWRFTKYFSLSFVLLTIFLQIGLRALLVTT